MNFRAVVVCGVILVGCGDGGPGSSVSFTPPTRGGGTPFAGSGGDRAGSSPDRGGGQSSAIGVTPQQPESSGPSVALRGCDQETPCGAGAYCNSPQEGSGHCFVTCKLETGQAVGDSELCPSGWKCVRLSAGTAPICRLPCSDPSTCPGIAPLSTRCSAGYCGWSQATPS